MTPLSNQSNCRLIIHGTVHFISQDDTMTTTYTHLVTLLPARCGRCVICVKNTVACS